MPSESDTNVVVRPVQPTAALGFAREVDCLPSEFDTSIVIRPPQHIIPQPRGIIRADLQRQLARAITRPVTLLIAGAGAGKTSLLARFCREQTHAIPLWYTLDSDDIEPYTVLARLCWAVSVAVPALRERLSCAAIARHPGYSDWNDVLAHWLDALHDSPRPLLLCIDGDGTTEHDPRLAALFSQLIRRLHPRLRIVFTCQTQPQGAFWAECARLRSRKRLALLHDNALRFSLDELRELCLFYGNTATEQELRELHARSGGWAYLLDYVLRTCLDQPIAAVVAQLPPLGAGTDLDAWFQAMLERTFDDAMITRLVCSAVPRRLTTASVAAICGLPEEQPPLEYWHMAIPALQEIQPGIYSYHSLFRSFLQRCFMRLPAARRLSVIREAAASAIAAGDWSEAAAQLATNGDWATLSQVLEARAARQVLDRYLDGALSDVISRLAPDVLAESPWVLCYQAMEQRIYRGDYIAACQLGQAAVEQFVRHGDDDGHARALAEMAIARYHLGQYMIALTELINCPLPDQPACAAALLFATYLNQIGIGALSAAIAAAHCGLQAIEREPESLRRMNWRIVIQRNIAVAYHYQGELVAARQAAEDALQLARPYYTNSYVYTWSLYELGVLEQRAGRLELALTLLQRARERVEQSSTPDPLWRWIVVAEGHALRDAGRLADADERYRLGGWGEGDEGPLMLWLLQGGHMEARLAVEARLAAAHASGSPFEVTNLTVFLALLDLEAGATPAIQSALEAAAEHYAALGFRHQRAGVQFHLAAVAYALDQPSVGDQILYEALSFGAASGYLNFTWWYPARMQTLLQHALQAGIAVEYAASLLHERGLIAQTDAASMPDEPATPAAAPNCAVLTLRCLGDFMVWVDDELLPKKRWQGHRAGAIRMQRLLLFLARHREPQSIEAIVRYVWPDIWKSIDVSTNFHLTLAGLRRVFEPELDQGSASRFVLTTPQGYQLRPDLAVVIDLDQFLEHLQRARLADPASDADLLRLAFSQAEQLYGGDFALAKPDPDEAEEYHRAAMEALCWLADDDLRRGACDSCIARARWLLREDAWNSAGSALLIAAYLQRGNRRAARQHYKRFVQMHGQPSPELLDLARAHWL